MKVSLSDLGEQDRQVCLRVLTEAFQVASRQGHPLAAQYIMQHCIGPLHRAKARAKRKRKKKRRVIGELAGHKVTLDVPEHVEIEEVP